MGELNGLIMNSSYVEFYTSISYFLDVIESAGSFGTIDRLDDDELFSQEKEKS